MLRVLSHQGCQSWLQAPLVTEPLAYAKDITRSHHSPRNVTLRVYFDVLTVLTSLSIPWANSWCHVYGAAAGLWFPNTQKGEVGKGKKEVKGGANQLLPNPCGEASCGLTHLATSPCTLHQLCVMRMLQRRGGHWWARGEGKRGRKLRMEIRGEAKSRWKCFAAATHGLIQSSS